MLRYVHWAKLNDNWYNEKVNSIVQTHFLADIFLLIIIAIGRKKKPYTFHPLEPQPTFKSTQKGPFKKYYPKTYSFPNKSSLSTSLLEYNVWKK